MSLDPTKQVIVPGRPSQETAESGHVSNQNAKLEAPVYSTLDQDEKEIRIIEVNDSLNGAGRVVCRLQKISLLSHLLPEYEALSWHWGDASKLEEIELNGQSFQVSRNAEEVLRRICIEHRHRVVWLDAICINQKDSIEKCNQISIMGDIYSKAARTIVWLGKGDERIHSAIISLAAVLEQFEQVADEVDTASDLALDDEALSKSVFSTKTSNFPLPSCDWEAITSFFSTPWFSRIWTVQEVQLAKDILFYQGEYMLPWQMLSMIAKWLAHRHFDVHVARDFNVHAILRLQFTLVTPEWGHADQLALICASSQATNPHDKIYALLGLLMRANDPEFVARFVRPNYNKPLHSVYTAGTRILIHSENCGGLSAGLGVLRYVGRLDSRDESEEPVPCLPSWVPQWSLGISYKDGEAHPYIRSKHRGAADGLPQMVASSKDPESPILRLKGILVDRVTVNLSSIVECLGADGTSQIACIEGYCTLWDDLKKRFPNKFSLKKKFALTLVQGEVPGKYDSSEEQEAERDVEKQFSYIYLMVRELYDSMISAASIEEQEENDAYAEEIVSTWYCAAISVHARRRAIFVSENGFIGMGPPGMQQGDVICVLFGGATPFALRPEGDRWKFLGDLYVYDLMDGSYVRKLRTEGKLEVETTWFDIH